MSARSFLIPQWTETVADLKAADGLLVYQQCSRCKAQEQVDLDAMIREFGALYSLWNREPPCPSEGCGGRLWYRAQPRDYFHRIMKDAPPHLVEPLHDRWRATLPADVRDTLPVIPMMKAADLCVAVGCGLCQLVAYLGPVDIGGWGAKVTMIGLLERVRCKEACEIALDLVARASIPPPDRPAQ